MKSLITILIFSLFLLLAIASGKGDSGCSGHEVEIENGYRERAAKMNMTIYSINVEYIGNCQYRVTQNTFDPGSAYSRPQNLSGSSIYKWK